MFLQDLVLPGFSRPTCLGNPLNTACFAHPGSLDGCPSSFSAPNYLSCKTQLKGHLWVLHLSCSVREKNGTHLPRTNKPWAVHCMLRVGRLNDGVQRRDRPSDIGKEVGLGLAPPE